MSRRQLETLSLAIALENDETDFIELRRILESESAYIAAAQDKESIAELKNIST